MKKLLTALFISCFFVFGAFAQTEQIIWEKDYKKAQALALETGRPLLLDFTAPWCKPCVAMDNEFWVLSDVVKATKPFIAVKIDFDNEKGLVSRFGVNAIPYVAFTDPLGNLITFRRGFGSKNVRELNQIFAEMPTDFSSLKPYYSAIENKKDDGAALYFIAESYRKSGMLFLSSEFYKRAAKTDVVKTDAEKSETIASVLGTNAYGYGDYKAADKYLDEYLKDYPAGKYRDVSMAILTISNAKLFKFKEAEKYLELLKTSFPESKNIPVAIAAIEQAKKDKDKNKK